MITVTPAWPANLTRHSAQTDILYFEKKVELRLYNLPYSNRMMMLPKGALLRLRVKPALVLVRLNEKLRRKSEGDVTMQAPVDNYCNASMASEPDETLFNGVST